jgi:hypothetical protein
MNEIHHNKKSTEAIKENNFLTNMTKIKSQQKKVQTDCRMNCLRNEEEIYSIK